MADGSGFEMVAVSGSSQIAAVGFNAETGQGKIQFLKNGSEYVYEDCTQSEADQIINGAIRGSILGGVRYNLRISHLSVQYVRKRNMKQKKKKT